MAGAGVGAAESLVPPSLSDVHTQVVSKLAQLSPDQLLKVRRMHKLRALLAKLPPGVVPPTTRRAAAAGGGGGAAGSAASASEAGADAIAFLANVACM